MSLATGQRKRKRLSKNKKKNWSKTDITDVEDHLETARIQLRTGGLAEEKTNAQLFFVDTDKDVTDRPKRQKKGEKNLKCHSLLEPDSKIKPAYVSHKLPKTSLKKLISTSAPKAKELRSLSARKKAVQNRRQELRKQKQLWTADKDLWTDEQPDEEDRVMKKQLVKVPKSMKLVKSCDIPAVEVALPGQSYNPALDDHQDLLRKALTVEEKKAKEAAKLRRALDDKFPSAKDAPTPASYIHEMSAGLFDLPNAADEVIGDISAVNPPVRRENKKTERQRKKEEARKQKLLAKQKLKDEKQKKNEFSHLKSLKRAVVAQEQEMDKRATQRAKKMYEERNKPKKLSSRRFEEPSLPLKLSHELEGSLRLLKPEGDLLEDRFRSLQKRNVIETRVRTNTKTKYKPKTFEKKGHKAISTNVE